ENEMSGVSYARHDAAAAILKDGCLIAAIEEERLSRIKHSNSFPYRAIRYCLDYSGAKLEDLDQIAVDSEEKELDRVGFSAYIKTLRSARVRGRQWIGNIFQGHLAPMSVLNSDFANIIWHMLTPLLFPLVLMRPLFFVPMVKVTDYLESSL